MSKVTASVQGKHFEIEAVDVQRVHLAYECYCRAESSGGEIIEFLVRFTTLWTRIEQRSGKLPSDDSIAFVEALKRMAGDRAKRALETKQQSQKITVKSGNGEDIEFV